MGYTHYWKTKRNADAETFSALVADAAALANAFEQSGDKLARGDGPEFLAERIQFNGAEPDDYETFVFRPQAIDFKFCKTQLMPYDRLVCAVLIAAKHHLGDGITVSSDGEWYEWAPGQELYRSVFPDRTVDPILSRDTDD